MHSARYPRPRALQRLRATTRTSSVLVAVGLVGIFAFLGSQGLRASLRVARPSGPPRVQRVPCRAENAAGAGSSVNLQGTPTEALRVASAAKTKLRDALKQHRGDVDHPEVVAATDELVRTGLDLGTSLPNSGRSPSLLGEFDVISTATFPGQLGYDDEGLAQFSLGRMSFNMFAPRDLVVTVKKMTNTLAPLPSGESTKHPEGTAAYTVICDLKTNVEGQQLDMVFTSEAVSWPDEADPNRLAVAFTAGTLEPAEGADVNLWRSVFTSPKKSLRQRLTEPLTMWMMKKMIGLEAPKGLGADGKLRYSMSKPPAGYLDIMYLDDDFRITKGNRGSVVIVDRQISSN